MIRDVLDQQLIDRNECKAGKVDGITLELREGQAPRVAHIDNGMDVRARRISSHLERLINRLRRPALPPFHIPWNKVVHMDINMRVDADVTKYSAFQIEQWLREHIIEKIPGNAHRKRQEKNE